MHWFVLVVSGILEAVWATALGRSEGLTRLGPTGVFVAALAASMAGLAFAMRGLPIGTAYAVWVGIGAVLTVTYAIATGEEPLTAFKVAFLVMIVGGVVGLKLAHCGTPAMAGHWSLSPALSCDQCGGDPNRRRRLVMSTARARNIPALAIVAR